MEHKLRKEVVETDDTIDIPDDAKGVTIDRVNSGTWTVTFLYPV